MSGTQWVLLVLVVLVVAGAYFYIRRQTGEDPWSDMDEPDEGTSLGGDSYIVGVRTVASDTEASADHTDTEPELASEAPAPDPVAEAAGPSLAATDDKVPDPANEAEAMQPRQPPAGDQKLFVLQVACRDERLFDGPEIHAALQAQKLKFGLNNIYHRITETNGVPESVFGIANLLKPGHLDPVEQDHLQTPGLALFLQLPGPVEGTQAMQDLLETASNLAEQLGAEVLDDRRSLLKPQMAQHMLDEVAEFDRQQRLASHS